MFSGLSNHKLIGERVNRTNRQYIIHRYNDILIGNIPIKGVKATYLLYVIVETRA